MTEADLTTKLGKWLKAYKNESLAIECKICKGKSLPFVAVKEHQESALFIAKHGLMTHKISDAGLGEKPFDLFMLARVPAFVVIFWYWKRGQRDMTLIDIDLWLEEKQRSERKSITFGRACVIGKLYQL